MEKKFGFTELVRTARFGCKSSRQKKANTPLKFSNLSFASLTRKEKQKKT